jgi:hypothetical protein
MEADIDPFGTAVAPLLAEGLIGEQTPAGAGTAGAPAPR